MQVLKERVEGREGGTPSQKNNIESEQLSRLHIICGLQTPPAIKTTDKKTRQTKLVLVLLRFSTSQWGEIMYLHSSPTKRGPTIKPLNAIGKAAGSIY